MPRSMADPNYRYTPWTPERRKAASEAGKRRWAEKRAREMAEWEKQQAGVPNKLRRARAERDAEMRRIAQRWHTLKAEVEEIDRALQLVDELRPLLAKHKIEGSLT